MIFSQIVFGRSTGEIMVCEELDSLETLSDATDMKFKLLGRLGSSVRQVICKGKHIVCLTGTVNYHLPSFFKDLMQHSLSLSLSISLPSHPPSLSLIIFFSSKPLFFSPLCIEWRTTLSLNSLFVVLKCCWKDIYERMVLIFRWFIHLCVCQYVNLP